MSLWIAHTARTLSEEIPAPPDQVRDFYVDLDNIKVVHPLVVSVQTLSRDHTADGYQQTYRVRDRIPLGPLSLGIAYWARVEVPQHGDVITEARQFLVQGAADGSTVHARHRQRIDPDNEN